MYHDPYVPIPAPEPEPTPEPEPVEPKTHYSQYLNPYFTQPVPEPEPTPEPEPVDPEKSHEHVTLYDLNDQVKALMEEIEALKAAAATEASAALIEDYFTVNETPLIIDAATNFVLVDPFCV